jgi:hypothetical protein
LASPLLRPVPLLLLFLLLSLAALVAFVVVDLTLVFVVIVVDKRNVSTLIRRESIVVVVPFDLSSVDLSGVNADLVLKRIFGITLHHVVFKIN